MNDFLHRTITLNPRKEVTGVKKKQDWVEFQLLDEQGKPLANILNATCAACASECVGQSDAEGVIPVSPLPSDYAAATP